MLTAREEATMKAEHFRKYDELAHWLGLNEVKHLVPFTAERIQQALASGDEHLNTLPLAAWDKQHGEQPAKAEKCSCCGQYKSLPAPSGVWVLLRQAIRRDRESGREPKVTSWSLSDTVCVLKHAARNYVAKES